jgi:hypothetical protein
MIFCNKFYRTQFLLLVILLMMSRLLSYQQLNAQGFASTLNLTPAAAVKNTGDKPQSKVWTHNGKWWTVFPNSSGTFVWRLDGTIWTSVLKISSSQTVKADCKVVANVCHILLWRKETYPSQLISVEYVPESSTYKLWSQRTSVVFIPLDAGVEIATIDIDGNGRMWLASDAVTNINVRWSDSPYSTWSLPITIASGIYSDDISDVIAMPATGQVGVLWSNQNTKRFGFKTHNDGADPAIWSADEVPASQSALNIKAGMADDHMNIAIAGDGTLYCAVKTGYDTPGYPVVALLRRHTTGVWDNLYGVSEVGTRPIVILNEATGKLKVVYTSLESGGNIAYKESSAANISFGPETMLISGVYDNATSAKNNYSSEIVILAADTTNTPMIYGVLATDPTPSIPPEVPTLLSPSDLASEIEVNPILTWNASAYGSSYHVQLSQVVDFSTIIFDQTNLLTTSVQVMNLAINTQYYWRVEALNTIDTSEWSATWSFSTVSQVPSMPLLLSPANNTTDAATNPTLQWTTAANATSYQLQVSALLDFSTTVINHSSFIATSYQISGLLNDTVYYWRVRATNSVGNSDWSPAWSFRTVYIIPNSLVGGWRMDEGSGITLTDESTFSNNAMTHGNPVWVAGLNGMALKLNGTNQYATVADASSLDVSQGVTLAAWIRPEKKASQYVIQKGETVDGYELNLLSTGKVSFQFNQITSTSDKLNSKTLYPTDGITWIHVAATFNGSVAKIYINGVLDKSITFSSPALINKNDLPVAIGAKNDGKSSLKGSLDDIRIYNYALAPSEIAELVNSSQNSGMPEYSVIYRPLILKPIKLKL